MVLGTIQPSRKKKERKQSITAPVYNIFVGMKEYGLILAKVIWNHQLECIENYISCIVCHTDDFQQKLYHFNQIFFFIQKKSNKKSIYTFIANMK